MSAAAAIQSEFATLTPWLDQLHQTHRVPGWAFVVSDRERTLVTHCSGTADALSGRPVTPDLRWQLGSVSKVFTSIALLQLERIGQLHLDDSVRQHLPWARYLNRDITIHHLLSHTGGLPSGSEWCPDSLWETALLGSLGDPQPPGAGYHYSNSGYEAAGDVVEVVSGMPLEQYLESSVLHPLGMTLARGAVRTRDRNGEVSGHTPPDNDRPWRRDRDQVPEIWFPTCTADGSIAATPEDMAQFARFLLSADDANTYDTVLPGGDRKQLNSRIVNCGEGKWYGYGLTTTETPYGIKIGHEGAMVGSFADLLVDPARGIGCVAFNNGFGDVWRTNGYVLDRLRAAVDGTPPPPEPDYSQLDEVSDDSSAPEFEPYVGLYRAQNPWLPALRVARRNGRLLLIEPMVCRATQLLPRGGGHFDVEEVSSPELVTFELEVQDRYLILDFSGSRYYRARRDPA